jgi:hypothetical protein
MLKRGFIQVFLILLVSGAYSQTNLVPNPSFESYTLCPTSFTGSSNNFDGLINWWVSSPSPDYFNACANTYTNGCVGVPYNGYGYQKAYSGAAYCGFYTMNNINSSSPTNYREYLSTQLTSTLTIGTKYYFSMQVSCAITYDTSFTLYCTQGPNAAINKIGALFTTNKYDLSHNLSYRNFAHVYANTVIADTANWTQIKGSFISDSTYQYISLGNFFDDSHTDTLSLIRTPNWHNPQLNYVSYYYIDEIIVSTDSLLTAGINKPPSSVNDILIYPNPAENGVIHVKVAYPYSDILIYDYYGTLVKETKTNVSNDVDVSELANGMYLIKIKNNKQQRKPSSNHVLFNLS